MELKQVIQAAPINFMRGATWRNKAVIVDEAQNMTVKELITIVTRISTNTTPVYLWRYNAERYKGDRV